MRIAKLITAIVLAALAQLIFAPSISVYNTAPDFMFAIICFAALSLTRGEFIPWAVATGLLADLLLGTRLGPIGLGFGLGIMVFERINIIFAPKVGDEPKPPRMLAGAILATLAGALCANLTVAILVSLIKHIPLLECLTRAGLISILTTLAFTILLPVFIFLPLDFAPKFKTPLGVRGE